MPNVWRTMHCKWSQVMIVILFSQLVYSWSKTQPFKWFTGLQQELCSQNSVCFINIYRQLGQETDRWSVLVRVHCFFQFSLPDSTYHNVTVTFGRIAPLYSVGFSVVMAVCQFLVFCGSWHYTTWAAQVSPQCRHVTLSWSQAGKRAFTFSNSVSLQRCLKKGTVLWNFKIRLCVGNCTFSLQISISFKLR